MRCKIFFAALLFMLALMSIPANAEPTGVMPNTEPGDLAAQIEELKKTVEEQAAEIETLKNNTINALTNRIQEMDKQIEKLSTQSDTNIPTIILSAVISALLSLGVAIYSSRYVYRHETRKEERLASRMLYYDFLSIEKYLGYVRKESINIRYFEQWQEQLAKCRSLSNNDIELIYWIYDTIYNYNNVHANNNGLRGLELDKLNAVMGTGDGKKEGYTHKQYVEMKQNLRDIDKIES